MNHQRTAERRRSRNLQCSLLPTFRVLLRPRDYSLKRLCVEWYDFALESIKHLPNLVYELGFILKKMTIVPSVSSATCKKG